MNKQTKEYLRELYRQSSNQTQDNLGTKGAFVILAFKMVFASIAIGLLVALGLLPKNDPIYKTVFVIFTSDIVGFVALWFISPIISLWNIPKIAALRNKAQQERLEEIDPKLVKISIEGFDQFLPPKERAAINIQNRDNNEFDGVIELLNFLVYQYDDRCREIELPFPVEANNSHFSPLKIKAKDYQVIDLSRMEGDKFVLLTERTIPLNLSFFALALESLSPPSPRLPVPPGLSVLPDLPVQRVHSTPSKPSKFIKLMFVLPLEIRGKFGNGIDFCGRYIVTIDFESDPDGPLGQKISVKIGNVEYIPKGEQESYGTTNN